MLHPSYSELMRKVNLEAEADKPIVESRYSIVMAASERAREIIDSDVIKDKIRKQVENEGVEPELTREELITMYKGQPLIDDVKKKKPLSIAVDEIYEGKVKIINATNKDIEKEENND